MNRLIKKKKPAQAPDWLIYSLKGLLLFLLFWNLNKHIPEEGLFASTNQEDTPQIYPVPYIEEITYSRLLSTTDPKTEHYMNWGGMEIPYIDPEFTADAPAYLPISPSEFAKIGLDSFTIHYKGHLLQPTTIHAIFIKSDSSTIVCEESDNFNQCFYPTLKNLEEDFILWLSIESAEEKTFFTKIKITQSTDNQEISSEEADKVWKKLINKDKHKSIDNLTVVQPVFKTYEYLFKWGNWERYAHGPRGGRRVKVGIAAFKKWANYQPYLFKKEAFVPFKMNISYWNTRNKTVIKKRNFCTISRLTETEPILSNNECFKNLMTDVEPGDVLSIFIFLKDDFLKKLSKEALNALPPFVVNNQFIEFSIPIEIVEEDFIPENAPLKLTTSTFNFQLNSALGDKAVIKLDTNNPKNNLLEKHYTESKSAKIIHIDDFKTIRRVITTDDIFIEAAAIKNTYTLTEKVYNTDTYPEFYDFNILPPLIKSRGLSTVLDKRVYPLNAYRNFKAPMEMYLGTEKVKILQLQLTIVPKEGKATRYITNQLDRLDINKRLNKLEAETSLYFDKILFERDNGEQLVFPLATALHLK